MADRKGLVLLVIGLLIAGLSGCTSVKPWERDTLARSEMAWDPDSQRAQRMNHIFFSKEASLRGGSAGGGGCGCN